MLEFLIIIVLFIVAGALTSTRNAVHIANLPPEAQR